MMKAMLRITLTHRFVGYRRVANIKDGQLRFKLCPIIRSQFGSLSGVVRHDMNNLIFILDKVLLAFLQAKYAPYTKFGCLYDLW